MNARKALRLLLVCLASDDGGQDLVEYALLAGLVSVGALIAIPTADALGGIYSDWVENVYDLWEPPAPTPGG